MKQIKTFIGAFLFLLFISVSQHTLAAPYGGQQFGQCLYARSCPVPPSPPAPVTPPPGNNLPDNDEDGSTISADTDGDGSNEQAVNADGDDSNGYEEYVDPDGSSVVLVKIVDDDDDSGTSFILDTTGDGKPNVYWDPDDEFVSVVEIVEDETETCWYYQNSNNEQRVYCIEKDGQENPTAGPTFGGTGNNRIDGAVEGVRRITSDAFGGEAYERVGEFVQKIPTPVAYSLPYALISLVGVLIIRLILQTKKELERVSEVAGKIRQEKTLLEEKQNFLMLSSHYMRTPMTVIKGNIELLQSLKSLNDQSAASLQLITNSIQEKIETMLSQLTKTSGLEAIKPPLRESTAKLKILLSAPVLLPVIAIIVISVFMQLVLIDFRVTRPSVIDVIIQTAVGLLLVQVFVSKYRSYKIHKDSRRDQQEIFNKQRELDETRANFVNQAAEMLGQDVMKLEAELQTQTGQGVDVSRIRKGSDQLKNVINKFVFAGTLQAGAVQAEKEQFSSKDVINQAIESQQARATEKNVSLHVGGTELLPVQNKRLVSIVLASLVENAVNYARSGTPVTVTTSADTDSFVFNVDNQGTPIAEEKVNNLFKPFARVESAETFDQEGLGFSLYLDRLIMLYMGGSISLRPLQTGTHAEISIPVLSN